MRKSTFMLKFIVAAILAFFLQLFLHEAGHAVFALITGNKVVDVTFGIVSYADIQVLNPWSIWIISIGSFAFPIIVCLALQLFNGQFVRSLNMVVLALTTGQLGINAVAVLCVKDFKELQTYDLGVCITSAGMNNILVSIVALVITVLLSICVVRKLKKIVDDA